uniref:Uncharacterized protein n=1 Tax=viral metagenome TaxID=1070528 RepID=A0A6H2A596_9ZZZZ
MSKIIKHSLDWIRDWRTLSLYLHAKICGKCKRKYDCIQCPQALRINELIKRGGIPDKITG